MHNSDLLLSPTPESREAGPSCGWLLHGTCGEILRKNENYFMRMIIYLIGFPISKEQIEEEKDLKED